MNQDFVAANLTEAETCHEIARLRRANRRWKRCSAVLAGVLACGAVVGLGGLRAAGTQDEPHLKQDEAPTKATLQVEEDELVPGYCNFCRVSSTPEEVIFDFGMNPQPFTPGVQKVRINNKLVMSFYTAKRFAAALVLAIQRHEKVYGQIELDVRKRVIHDNPNEPGA